ncbi:neutral/alkaline non-lysosomal ceramidase N-terminal domain-containing protein [Desulfurococcaceae archaeon MEX13E-LK6-19]|nr:neutral/alkaline non-lysosomal ceramidase N-terminal domain-containing protein [Desulfurococcaceae archaeon MEX13E-LK6-19]
MVNNYIAGFAKTVITPEKSMPMAGYINREHHATGKLDDLYARVLYLESPLKGSVLIVSLDLIRIDNELYKELRNTIATKYNLNPDSIHVVATHTHSGPEISLEVWNTKPLNHIEKELVREYRNFLLEKITETVGTALNNLHPVKIQVGSTQIEGVASNRVDPNGPIDNETVIITIKDSEDNIRAIVINYACHPTVLGPLNTLYSGDLAGKVSKIIEDTYNCVCLYLNGAAGNVSTRFTRRSQDYHEVEKFASLIVNKIKEKLTQGLEEIPVSTITTTWHKETIKLRNPPSEEELRLAEMELKRRLEEALKKNYNEAVLRGLKSDLAATLISKERRWFLEKNRFIELEIALTRIGDYLSILFFPGEAFIEYQISAKQCSTTKYTVFVGYANGYWGYIPYKKHSPKLVSYEEVVSMIDPSEYPKIEMLIKKALGCGIKDLALSSTLTKTKVKEV